MKNLSNRNLHLSSGISELVQVFRKLIRSTAVTMCPLLFILFSAGCKKEVSDTPPGEIHSANRLATKSKSIAAKNSDGNVVNDYPGLSPQTRWELQQARAATAKYKHIKHAIKDGYADIGVNVEGMGHHYMKSSLVDGTFDIREPEILVYNRNEDGVQELVALEYAVVKSSAVAPAPEGFSGSSDVWDGGTVSSLWLVHAWVWRYNPAGVFHPTNPTVHLH